MDAVAGCGRGGSVDAAPSPAPVSPCEVLGLQDLLPNGIQCYGCDTHECSSSDTSLINCRGPMTQCLEATGMDGEARGVEGAQ